MDNVRLTMGDITGARVDAIVNAANSSMLGGGGVDRAIHLAAGPALHRACEAAEVIDGLRCPTGEARITTAGKLPARYVIHAVGPRYHTDPQPEVLLDSAYRSAFELALQHNCATVAAPAISCGIFGYPLEEAAEIALGASCDPAFRALTITFYLFGQDIRDIFAAAHRKLTAR